MLRTARKFPRRQYDSPHGQAVLGDEVQLKHFSRTPKLHVFFCPDPLSSVAADDDEVGNRWTELTDADRTQLSMSRRERHRERERETMFRELFQDSAVPSRQAARSSPRSQVRVAKMQWADSPRHGTPCNAIRTLKRKNSFHGSSCQPEDFGRRNCDRKSVAKHNNHILSLGETFNA